MGCVFGVILTTGAPAQAYFLDAANGVRPAGMGDAFTGVADDANTVLFNPAGFARLSSYEFTGMYADLYHNFNPVLYTGQTDQLNYNFLSLAAPVAQIGTFGVSWTHLYSTFYKENVFTLSYGRNLVPGMLDFGLNAKFLEWLVEANDYSTDSDYYVGDRERLGLTADVGLLFTPFEGFTLGASADNVIPVSMGSSGSEKVPLMWRAGAAFKKRWQESAMNSVQFSLEWEQRGTLATPKAGLELWLLSESIGLRGGVNTDQASGGLSYRYHVPASPMDIQLDYAFGFPFHILGTAGSHRAGLTARWGAEKTAPASDSSEEMPAELKPEEKPAAGPGAREMLAAARAVLPGALNLLGYTLARCRIACGRIRFRAGLDNAADTGILFGIVQAINGVLAPTPFRVDMTPLFDGGEAAGRAEGRVLIERPLTILIAAALFAVSAPVRTAVWPLIRGEA